MKWFALCEGEGLKLCETCKRLADKWPEDAKDRFQSRVAPVVDGERCAHWIADNRKPEAL